MATDQQFCLRWNNHQSTLISVFDSLLENGTLVDCTLAAEGKYLKAHKVVLSACSPYLETLLSQHYEKHPIVILKDVKFTELKSMMDYMYRGEVNISQDQLGTFLKAAESLQIKGLSDNGDDAAGPTTKRQEASSRPSVTEVRNVEAKRPAPSTDLSDASREGSISPSSLRKRRRTRRSSQGDDPDSHLDSTSNACDFPINTSQTTTPLSVPSTTVVPTPVQSLPKQIVKQEPSISRIDNLNSTIAPESGLLKEKIEPPSEPLLEPKTEYLDYMNNENSIEVEDLTLDDDEELDSSMDASRPGPSHGDMSNQGYQWPMSGDQSGTDEIFMAAQQAVGAATGQQRDSQGDSINRKPDLDQEEYNFASAFCSVGYGPTDNYFSELNNCILHVDNASHSFEKNGLSLGKEIDDFNRVFYVDNTVYHNELSIQDDTKNSPFLGKYGMICKRKKRSSKYNKITTKVGNCNNGHKQGSKKEKRVVKQKIKKEIFSSWGRKPTGEVEVTSSGRERRPLVWSGDSFTTVSTTCEPYNELKKTTKRKGWVESKISDPASVTRKKVHTNRSMYYKSGIHSPGTFSCETCGRKYRYLRGLRQHMRDSCEQASEKYKEGGPSTECALQSSSTPPRERRASNSPEFFAGFSPKEITKKRFTVVSDSPAVRVSQPRTSKSRAALVWKKGGRFIEETIKLEPEDMNETPSTMQSKSVEEIGSLGRRKRVKKPKTNDSDEELEEQKIDSRNKRKTDSIIKQEIDGTLEVKSGELEDGNFPSTSSKNSGMKKYDFSNAKTSKMKRRIKKKSSNTNGFKCDQCGRKYKYLRGLRQHKKLECNKEPQFPCPYCPSRFRYRQNIREHVRNNHEQAFPKWYATHYVVPMFL